MTGAWLLANDLKQISDCTGGREMMQFDTASQNNLKKKSFIRNGKI
ncbi:unknown [Bacteroides sp. CAG:1060]|nr:unknown [Bacteroides sp. CAG:1060]